MVKTVPLGPSRQVIEVAGYPGIEGPRGLSRRGVEAPCYHGTDSLERTGAHGASIDGDPGTEGAGDQETDATRCHGKSVDGYRDARRPRDVGDERPGDQGNRGPRDPVGEGSTQRGTKSGR